MIEVIGLVLVGIALRVTARAITRRRQRAAIRARLFLVCGVGGQR